MEEKNIRFIPIETDAQLTDLSFVADTVWHECFKDLLSKEQINYMVSKFQSFKAMKEQIKNGYNYFFINADGINVGYIGVNIDNTTGKLFLSKLYILKSFRGKGYSRAVFDFIEGICEGMKLHTIWLTVNKYNERAKLVYNKMGFTNIKSQVTDIGSGYVMDDYVMEKKIS